MKPIFYSRPLQIYCITVLFLAIFSCNQKERAVPFPENENEYSRPADSPLQFSEPKKIEWSVNDTTNFKAATVKKVNLENLPSKPFYPDGFLPLNNPIEEINFDFTTLPDTLINIKELASKPIRFKTSIIEPPLSVPAGLPKLKKNASMGILEFGEDQGLPGYLVTAMMEDSYGMMWIGSDKGLCRFNGEYIEIYSFIDNIFTGALAEISSMLEDNKGRIWIYTSQKGIYVLDLKAGVVRNANFIKQEFNFNPDCSMVMDSRGFIWLGTIQDGFYILNPSNETYRHVSQLQPQDNGNAKRILEDSSGNIWISSIAGLSIIDYDKGRIRFLNSSEELSMPSATAFFNDRKNRIWVGTEDNGISILDLEHDKIQNLGSSQGFTNSIQHFTQGNDDKLWMSTAAGVYVFDVEKQRLQQLTANKGLSDNLINTTYFDRLGQIWIATSSALNLMDTEGLMPKFLTAADGLSGPDVWSFFEDNKAHLWIASRQGIDIYDPLSNTIREVDHELGLNKAPNISYKILPMPTGEYLIVSPRFGLGIFSPELQTIRIIGTEQGLNIPIPSSSLVDHRGHIWNGSFQNGTVEYMDSDTNTFKLFTNKNGLVGDIVWELMEDDKGQIWVATDKSINIINVADNTISQLMENGKISERNGGAFLRDAKDRMWIATRSGILIADQNKGTLTSLNTENGLVHKAVYTLYENEGKIYAGTENGFTVFTPKSEEELDDTFSYEVKSFGKGQGLKYTDFNAGAAIVYEDKLWWGIETQAMTISNIPKEKSTTSIAHIVGITISDEPQTFYEYRTILQNYPKLDTLYTSKKDTFYISEKIPKESGGLRENNISWDSLDGYYNLPVNLKIPFEQNYLSFQFTGAQLTNIDKTRYRYILEGFDTEWSEITEISNSKNYRNLAAGDYLFKVRSRTADGIWSEPAEMSFTILPHWTNTWWAWSLYVLAFIIVVGMIAQYRARLLKKENLILEEKVKHRTAQLNKSVEDLKATQSQLIQSEKMASLGELTAGIAHEIQNPLNFVNNFSEVSNELIQEIQAERTKQKENRDEKLVEEILVDIQENLEKINHHGKRADAIVKGMLQHSRNSSGEKRLTDINALCDEYTRLSYHGLRAKDKSFNADIKTDFDENISKVEINQQDIGRVILNLVNNAFYAVHEKKIKTNDKDYKPLVQISTQLDSGGIIIQVKDNGNGIPDKVKEKIFQPFFTTKPTGKGTGLGLSLSYDIIKAHNGQINVETVEGENTKFTIFLPC